MKYRVLTKRWECSPWTVTAETCSAYLASMIVAAAQGIGLWATYEEVRP